MTPFGDLSKPNPVGQGPSEADEMSASAFLAAVKGRLMEWGKVGSGAGDGRWEDSPIKMGYYGCIMVDKFVDHGQFMGYSWDLMII